MQCKPCCFFISARTGAVIIAILTLVTCGLNAIVIVLKMVSPNEPEGGPVDESFVWKSIDVFGDVDEDKIRIIIYMEAVNIAVLILIHSLLIFGVKYQRLGIIKAVLICYIIEFLRSLANVFMRFVKVDFKHVNLDGFGDMITFLFLPIIIRGYLVFVIYRAYGETKDALSQAQESIENSAGFHQL
ncbi:unnamed protein product [Orchesella dallaii]|uniref:Transmembrane protein n=1 Tax=Orchesella dallaii TaxID=48710 RepID=A0ABP1R5V6_9HEXA